MKEFYGGIVLAAFSVAVLVQRAIAEPASVASSASSKSQSAPIEISRSNRVQLPSHALINATNAATYKEYLPAALQAAIGHGFTARVVPAARVDWSKGFTDATEQYSPQATLDKHDYLINYTAGIPFPAVEVTDPKAAVKIAYNWHMGPFMPDDFSLAPWGSFAYASLDQPNAFVPKEDYQFICDQFRFLRFAHRTEVEPKPTLNSNSQGFEWKARCNEWTANPSEGSFAEGSGIWIRYVDPERTDEFYGYDSLSRKLKRSNSEFQPNQNCRSCHQPYWAYALPKTEGFTYRLLGTTPILGCLSATAEPAGLVQGAQEVTMGEEPFELRNAYILEMTPKSVSESKQRDLVYIDTEAYVWLAAEFFDGSERTATAFPLWRSHPAPSGGSLFDLAGEFYVPTSVPGMSLATESASSSKWFFRTLVPAHGGFDQKINTGSIPEVLFNPQSLAH